MALSLAWETVAKRMPADRTINDPGELGLLLCEQAEAILRGDVAVDPAVEAFVRLEEADRLERHGRGERSWQAAADRIRRRRFAPIAPVKRLPAHHLTREQNASKCGGSPRWT